MKTAIEINVLYETTIKGLVPLSMERPGEKPQPVQFIRRKEFPGVGIQYTCRVAGESLYLWFKEKRWFIYEEVDGAA